VQSDQLCYIGADMTSATSLSLSVYNLLLYGKQCGRKLSFIQNIIREKEFKFFCHDCDMFGVKISIILKE